MLEYSDNISQMTLLSYQFSLYMVCPLPIGAEGKGVSGERCDRRDILCTGKLLGVPWQVCRCINLIIQVTHIWPHSTLPCSASFVEGVDPALSKGIHWRCDPSKVGGGVLMDGATHWVRPLRMWSVPPSMHWLAGHMQKHILIS